MEFKRPSPKQTLAVLIALLICVPVLLFASRNLWLPAIGHALVFETQPSPGEGWIVLLMGDPSLERARTALKAYKEGKGTRLVFSPIKDDDVFMGKGCETQAMRTQRFFLENGVPEDHIRITDCLVTSTADEAQCIQKLMRSEGKPSFVVGITSWYHTSRSAWLFQKSLGENSPALYWIPAPTHEGGVNSWWKFESTFISVFAEYVKWIYWRLDLDSTTDHVRS